MNKVYLEKYKDKIISLLLVCSTFYLGILKIKHKFISLRIIGFLLVLLSIYKGSQRNYYLPFLGDTVFPNNLISGNTLDIQLHKGSDIITVNIDNLPPNVKVIYWAALPENSEKNKLDLPWVAYKDYSNSGSTTTDSNGKATMKIMYPQSYKTPWNKKLKPHIHYRYFKTKGMMSEIYTKFL